MNFYPYSLISASLLWLAQTMMSMAQPVVGGDPNRPLKGAEKQVQMFGGMYRDSDHQMQVLRGPVECTVRT
jgi:hypothetical protein